MIRGGDIGKGTVLLIKNAPYLVVEREFVNPGKGTAFARVKMKNLKDGTVLTQTIKTPDMVEDAEVETRTCQYQYNDGENYIFMDAQSFDTVTVPESLNENLKYYLKEGEEYPIVIWEDEPIDVKVPQKMIFVVAESENYVRGDTVSNGGSKDAKLETGMSIRVPLFIEQGEKISVDTTTGKYDGRAN